jgi:hypothetical protein
MVRDGMVAAPGGGRNRRAGADRRGPVRDVKLDMRQHRLAVTSVFAATSEAAAARMQ